MSMGGDSRITLKDESGLNTYGHAPFPKFAVSYSSCTSNTISVSAYSYVESYLNVLLHQYPEGLGTDVFVGEFEKIRNKIASYYELSPGVDMVFGSSGTDIELIQLALSLSYQQAVHNIVLAANEVGSGIEHAARGRYFSDRTPKGIQCKLGGNIAGFPDHLISYANIDIRRKDGSVRDSRALYEAYLSEIEKAIAQGKRVIVHAIHRSKTGLILPGFEEIEKFINGFGHQIDVVVDCCQGRVSIRRVNEYLRLGASVLLTGSKFYSGPPFSGLLLLPPGRYSEPLNVELYPGLKDFFSSPEYPLRWQSENMSEAPDDNNLGLLLRWKAAVYEMNKVFLVPNKRIEFVINAFNRAAREMIEGSKFLTEITASSQTKEDTDPGNTESPFELNSIITFAIQQADGSALHLEDAKTIHESLYSDLRDQLGLNDKIASVIIQLGQPVKVLKNADNAWSATLRLALSSNLIGELGLLDDDIVEMRFKSDMQMVHDKIELVLNHLDALRNTGNHSASANEQ
ncbi:MAG: hypothetical protein EA392_00905 [Cryomorphaceae bacterium]|nr:MAG: hypothetical protein EA392_00905 [Cryomorphaceae bacterium]